MFCPKCGNQNEDTNRFCRKCGRPMPVRSQPVPPVIRNLIGQVIDGKYKLISKLGSGGMGDVYGATRLMLGDMVAIKLMHPHLATEVEAGKRFRQEALAATKLRHRNVVSIFDVGVSAAHGLPYILMEKADGHSLRTYIKDRQTSRLDFAVTVVAQVAAALDEAHRLGIVHRDIKPENIIAKQTDTGWLIKILDFGIAKLHDQADLDLTQDGNAMGTPQYMSPEQCQSWPLDGRSDIYSLGIVLYELLCGTVPFKAPSGFTVATMQVNEQPRAPRSIAPEIHPEVEQVVLASLAKSPDDRPRTAAQFSQWLIQAATVARRSVSLLATDAPSTEPETSPPDASPEPASGSDQPLAAELDIV